MTSTKAIIEKLTPYDYAIAVRVLREEMAIIGGRVLSRSFSASDLQLLKNSDNPGELFTAVVLSSEQHEDAITFYSLAAVVMKLNALAAESAEGA